MRSPNTTPLVALALVLALAAGCSKKTTKIDTAPEKPAPQRQASSASPASDEMKFETGDMDAEMRAVLVPVYFDYDRYNLRQDAVSTMERIAAFLEKNEGVRIMIEGNADERGTDEYNVALGENRARSARNYLTGYGLASNRFEMVSYGKARPANPDCEDDPCHALNRRVEWKVLAR